jgi:hypothetical protein
MKNKQIATTEKTKYQYASILVKPVAIKLRRHIELKYGD